jgi:serine/threonine-protein kinase
MSAELVAGQVIGGRYRLDRLLGQGGMGVVWAATHTITRRPAALKFLRGPDHARPEMRARFMREARAASAVHHPNVLEVLDVFELEDETPVMVMDLLRGETLANKLAREAPLSIEVTARIVAPVVSAVGAAHALGIVHRDLKPDNIFLATDDDGRERVKVLDFGIAKLMARDEDPTEARNITGTGSMLGTPCYMAPEQACGEKDIDGRVDAWAIGIILYEALSGRRPIDGANVGQVLKQILAGTIPPLAEAAPSVPVDVAALVDQLLRRERNARPADLREALAVLRRHTDVTVREFGVAVIPSADGALAPPASDADVSSTAATRVASEASTSGNKIVVENDASPSEVTAEAPSGKRKVQTSHAATMQGAAEPITAGPHSVTLRQDERPPPTPVDARARASAPVRILLIAGAVAAALAAVAASMRAERSLPAAAPPSASTSVAVAAGSTPAHATSASDLGPSPPSSASAHTDAPPSPPTSASAPAVPTSAASAHAPASPKAPRVNPAPLETAAAAPSARPPVAPPAATSATKKPGGLVDDPPF